MTCCKNTSINNRYKQISIFGAVASEFTDQWNRDDIDDSNCDHRRYRTGCVDLGTLIDILCHCSTEGSIWNIYAGVSQNQQTVSNDHIYNLCLV